MWGCNGFTASARTAQLGFDHSQGTACGCSEGSFEVQTEAFVSGLPRIDGERLDGNNYLTEIVRNVNRMCQVKMRQGYMITIRLTACTFPKMLHVRYR